jgi:GntR family transcriptional regulator
MQFQIDLTSREPLYQQLINQLRAAIARGHLVPGDALPSLRQMSRDLVINPNTVARAYTELEREGVLYSRAGRGVFVAEPKADLKKSVRREKLVDGIDEVLTKAVHLGFTSDEVLALVADRLHHFQWIEV